MSGGYVAAALLVYFFSVTLKVCMTPKSFLASGWKKQNKKTCTRKIHTADSTNCGQEFSKHNGPFKTNNDKYTTVYTLYICSPHSMQ